MGTLSNNLLINLIAGSIVLIVSTSFPAYAKKVKKLTDPALVQALHQETYDTQTKVTDMDLLIWLSAMSSKLERRIPNAFYRIRLLSAIYRESRAEGLDPQLVLALIEVESNFDRNALSHAGAQGLMQVMPFWKNEIGSPEDDLYNPLTSLRYGCRILRHYLDRYPNAIEALAAYNGSHGRTVYPDKVLGRLDKHWRFKNDQYASQSAFNSKLASSDAPAEADDRWILN
ncbi:MAG: lytic transglycosylase domain-containing protein [Gammaproteobacteria bacterium]|nr:lytic transglycosylase domain-containing protein [Gammaproteobacteria bacterium]